VKIEQIAKDFLIPIDKYPHIGQDQTLQEAVEALQSMRWGVHENLLRFSELLVLNADNQVVGRLTVQDILAAMEPRLLKLDQDPIFKGGKIDSPNLAILWEQSFFKQCKTYNAKKVGEVMSPIATVLKTSQHILVALHTMLHNNETHLPVLAGDEVIGVLRLEEVFTVITGLCAI